MKVLTMRPALAAGLFFLCLAGGGYQTAQAQFLSLVSRAPDPLFFGLQGSANSGQCDLSGTGRYLVFSSYATNLVANDTNGEQDIFFLDRDTGVVRRVNVNNAGDQANGFSRFPRISGSGRYVVYESDADNLVPGDSNNATDVFRFDLMTDTVIRISIDDNGMQSPDGGEAPSISNDGDRIAFVSSSDLVGDDFNGDFDAYVRIVSTNDTTRVSTDPSQADPDDDTFQVVISGDGQWVAIESTATNLVANDSNGVRDIFLRNISTTVTVRVEAPGGIDPDAGSDIHDISNDGQSVLFSSAATNFVTPDSNGLTDVFVYDALTTGVELISINTLGDSGDQFSQQGAISGGGRYVAIESYANDLIVGDVNPDPDIFLYDRMMGTTELISQSTGGSQGIGFSFESCMSGDATVVGFASSATNLISNDDNGVRDVVVRDRVAVTTTLGSMADAGGPYPLIGGNEESNVPVLADAGNYALLRSRSTNFLGLAVGFNNMLYRVDLDNGSYFLVSQALGGDLADGTPYEYGLSADGGRVVYATNATNLIVGDSNGLIDIYLRQISSGLHRRVSVDSLGVEADGASDRPAISADGQFVVFESEATNLVASDGNGEQDIFVHDVASGMTTRVSVSSNGTEADDSSEFPDISGDGHYVVFSSGADNLVAVDNNPSEDVYRHDRMTGLTELVCLDNAGIQADSSCRIPKISLNGRYVMFETGAVLDPGDNNGTTDLYIRDMSMGNTTLVSLDESNQQFTTAVRDAQLSGDGRSVVFTVPGVGDDVDLVYLRNLNQGRTVLLSRDRFGALPGDDSIAAGISANGDVGLFSSLADGLVAGEFNGKRDVFVVDPGVLFVDSLED